ncbi:hypothetical protein H0H87_006745 [Tephrocybe sp. NHM501043]|nr:hypothetical protein H0H87_006745 [Tephrocybe sp. NHM501043]
MEPQLREMVQRMGERILALEAQRRDPGGDRFDSQPRSDVPSTADLLAAEEGALAELQLREMVQRMSERILALEAQQSAPVGDMFGDTGVIDYEGQLRPPPGYSQARATASPSRPPSPLVPAPDVQEPAMDDVGIAH